MGKNFVHLLDVLGAKRVEDLLIKVRPDLKDKAQNIKALRETCNMCGEDNIAAWKFEQDGEVKHHRQTEICASCMVSAEDKSFSDEMHQKRQGLLEKKWYRLSDQDDSGFRNYEETNSTTEKALKKAIKYVKDLLAGNSDFNLLMTGSCGTGKSHLAKAIARTAKHEGLSVGYIEAADLFDLIKETFGHDRYNKVVYDELASFQLLIIDDVGLETKKKTEVSWTTTEWTKITNARKGKATVYTTNYDDLSLPDVIGPRAHSRMYTNSDFIDLFTDDYRKTKLIR